MEKFPQEKYISSKDYMADTIEALQDKEPRTTGSAEMFIAFFVGAGSGGGKTRLLMEIFRYYTENEKDTIVIPITFNGDGIIAAELKGEPQSKLFLLPHSSFNQIF